MIAPEVLMHMDHSYAADYFAIGVMTYELMMGIVTLNNKSGHFWEKTEKKLNRKYLNFLSNSPHPISPSAIPPQLLISLQNCFALTLWPGSEVKAYMNWKTINGLKITIGLICRKANFRVLSRSIWTQITSGKIFLKWTILPGLNKTNLIKWISKIRYRNSFKDMSFFLRIFNQLWIEFLVILYKYSIKIYVLFLRIKYIQIKLYLL